jgi:hypothetical protein
MYEILERLEELRSILRNHEQKLKCLETLATETSQVLQIRASEKEYLTVEEFAEVVPRAPYTVRSWLGTCRLYGVKVNTRCGPHAQWSIPWTEYLRYKREGLLPARRPPHPPNRDTRGPGAAGCLVRPKKPPKAPPTQRRLELPVESH